MEFNRPKTLQLVKFPTGDYDTWTKKERVLMEAHASTWASEYVKDFDVWNTAVRLGFVGDDIKVAIKRYMKHWLVQAYIDQLQERYLTENLASKDRLTASTMRDACDFSPSADPRARVTAQKTAAQLLGADPREKTLNINLNQSAGIGTGGVLLMNYISPEDWRKQAPEQQRKLKEEVRK